MLRRRCKTKSPALKRPEGEVLRLADDLPQLVPLT
jgi:hypothetical protein